MSLKFRIAIVIFVLEAVMMALVLWKTLGHAVDSSERQIKASEEAALAIVSNIGRLVIQRHSGAVRASGQAGRGATFYFTLHQPRPAEQPPHPAGSMPRSAAGQPGQAPFPGQLAGGHLNSAPCGPI